MTLTLPIPALMAQRGHLEDGEIYAFNHKGVPIVGLAATSDSQKYLVVLSAAGDMNGPVPGIVYREAFASSQFYRLTDLHLELIGVDDQLALPIEDADDGGVVFPPNGEAMLHIPGRAGGTVNLMTGEMVLYPRDAAVYRYWRIVSLDGYKRQIVAARLPA